MTAFGKLGSVGSDQQRQVRERRRSSTRGLKDQNVFECVRKMILAADNVADLKIGIVGAGSQMVGWHPVATQQREVFDIGSRLGLVAIDGVGEVDSLSILARNAKTNDVLFAGSSAAVTLFRAQFAHSGVEQPGSAGARLFTFIAIGRSEIAIRHPAVEDRFRDLLVEREAFGLAIL